MNQSLLVSSPVAAPDPSSKANRDLPIPEIDLIAETLERGFTRARLRTSPTATYRQQFNRHFRFTDAARIAPYLAALGVTHAYASPYLHATPGSEHGYDIIDHQSLNPEVGSPEEFAAWVAALRTNQMGHILDFVPNHMGVATNGNAWWQDVLENGPSSSYAAFFDIDWSPLKSDLSNKVLLPVLGDQFGVVLENRELTLEFERGAFFLRYFSRRFPITPRSYARILGERVEELAAVLGEQDPLWGEYQSILTALKNLPSHEVTEPDQRHEREREKEVIKRRLHKLCEESPQVDEFIKGNLERFNGVRGEPASFDAMEQLLREQPYRLSYWRVAADEINYRRFFDINELAAVCMEQPEVFAKSHSLVLRLIAAGQLDGLRIDHADGLYDPAGYLQQLQIERLVQLCREEYAGLVVPASAGADCLQAELPAEAADRWNSEIEPAIRKLLARDPAASAEFQPLYVVAEKILERHEKLPVDWAVAGTTGYDFVNEVNGLFVAAENERPLDALYRRFAGQDRPLDELAYNAKRLIMKVAMSSELAVLGHQLDRISECNRLSCDHTLNGLTHALREVVASFPVYRTYIASDHVVERDRNYIEQAVARAKRRNPAVSHIVFDFVKDVLLMRHLDREGPQEGELRRKFVRRFQQFTGPVMAKSFEDTVFYRYNRLASLNEVGGDPKRFGVSVATFHQQNQDRQSRQPYAMLATSTHDTKRSEDVRARINVLSEIPAEWKERVLRWARWHKRKKTKVDGELAPSRNDEYLLYQTILGTWPIDKPPGSEYTERISRYMLKAIREAKVHSSWIAPHEEYERAVREFVAAILCAEPASAFRVDFEPFAERIARAGWWNSLAQTLLKVTSPGVPDVFPGTETWTLTLVDPDNRQPVDFEELARKLEEIQMRLAVPFDRAPWIAELLGSAVDGRIKLFVLSEALRLRRAHPVLFTLGQYIPLDVSGPQAQHVVAFARIHGAEAVIIAVPRLTTTLTGEVGAMPTGGLWEGATIELPESLHGRTWRHLFTGVETSAANQIAVSNLLGDFPVGLLVAE